MVINLANLTISHRLYVQHLGSVKQLTIHHSLVGNNKLELSTKTIS